MIAEGVETAAQLQKLQALGCDCAQGFLLARPVDAVAAEQVIRDWENGQVGVGLDSSHSLR